MPIWLTCILMIIGIVVALKLIFVLDVPPKKRTHG